MSITDYFIGPRRAVGWICMSVCVFGQKLLN